MAKNYFNLSTDAKLFEELGKRPTWWKTILSDKELYVNVRKDNRINVYYLGASVMELYISRTGSIEGKIHSEYFKPQPTKEYLRRNPTEIVSQLDEIKERIRNYKKPNNPEGDSEKAIQGKLYIQGGYIDTEYEFVNDRGVITRIDFTSLHKDGMLEFVELKRISDNRLLKEVGSLKEEEIIDQMKRYKLFIGNNTESIVKYYEKVLKILKKIGVDNPLLAISINGVLPEARLLFAGYKDGKEKHPKRQVRVERIKQLLESNSIRSNIADIQKETGTPQR